MNEIVYIIDFTVYKAVAGSYCDERIYRYDLESAQALMQLIQEKYGDDLIKIRLITIETIVNKFHANERR